MFGNRNDLPSEYINMFLDKGFSIFSIDYLLAPESHYSEIVRSVEDGLNYFLENAKLLGLPSNKFVLFGRSAGAYLCMQLMLGHLQVKPDAFIDLYGFDSLKASNLKKPNMLYSSYPAVSEQDFKSLISSTPIAHSTYEDRFLLYVYARQTGKWQSLIFNTDVTERKLTKEIAKTSFPPTYICQSNSDPDVPFINSILLKSKLPNAILLPVNSKEHDFDRTVNDDTINQYQKISKWLASTVK